MNSQTILSSVQHLFFKHGNEHRYFKSLIYACWQAKLAGYTDITCVELGVANGHGIEALIKFKDLVKQHLDLSLNIVGFDTGYGLPEILDYRDHPEIYNVGQYAVADRADLESRFGNQATIVWGDVCMTMPDFVWHFSEAAPLAFVSLDLDLYSSTNATWPLFEMSASHYLPAVSIHADDVNVHLTFNPWCGESLSLDEFNAGHVFRKFEQKHACWNVQNFYVFHVLDHPIRNRQQIPAYPIDCCPISEDM